MTTPTIIFLVMLAAVIALLILAWKKNDKLYWVGAFVLDVAGNLTFLFYMAHFYQLRTQVEDGTLSMINPPEYGTFSVICLIFALVFFAALLISIVLAVGKKLILKEEGPKVY